MKKWFLFIILAAMLTACSRPAESPQTDPIPVSSPAESTPQVVIPEETTPVETQPTAPPHSELYIPGLSVEDVILYFNEVCLDAEIINSGDPSRLQKWEAPISYFIHGNPTGEDLETLESFVTFLNTIEGFPGMCETNDPFDANLDIHFCGQEEMLNVMGPNFTGMDGAVTFWYEYDVIYDAVICYRTDLDQYLRNSVILEEVYNGLGPIQDTSLRPDSIIYSEFSQPQVLTEVDKLILRLLYNPEMKCGMNASTVEEIIRKLYY